MVVPKDTKGEVQPRRRVGKDKLLASAAPITVSDGRIILSLLLSSCRSIIGKKLSFISAWEERPVPSVGGIHDRTLP